MKYRTLAMDCYSSAGKERTRVAPGAKPRIIEAADEDEAIEKAKPFFRMPHDFIDVRALAATEAK